MSRKLSASWFYKAGTNWRQLFASSEYELCSYTKQLNQAPFIKSLLIDYHREYPNLPQVCPILARRYYQNYTGLDADNKTISNHREIYIEGTEFLLPNGRYRVIGRLRTEHDSNCYYLDYQYVRKRRFGEENF